MQSDTHADRPEDAPARQAALDPQRSFIVQAPAGSGKTELLIQRYLALLPHVENPEEIAAITFTGKAAAEMRSRVVAALERAESPEPPDAPHERQTWQLARAALSQNDRRQWQLTDNPGRLRIQTIDALCAAIARHMPYLSRFGAPPEIAADPEPLYRRAARETLAEVEAGSKWSPAIEALIRHLDNQLERLENLIAGMLARRDQWLRHIAGREDSATRRHILEDGLKAVISEGIAACRGRFPAAWVNDVLDLARYAAKNLEQAEADSPIRALKDIRELPASRPECLEQWQGLSELLLTRQGDIRRQADVRLGFPAPGSAGKNSELKNLYQEKKQSFKAVLEGLRTDPVLAALLDSLRCLPEPEYTDSQWEIMQALFEMLRLAVAHLELAFQSEGCVDFSEVALRAASALGSADAPTDLALSMDYRIRHILIDEFQDTSITQLDLLERLTMGWEPNDGRSFFAVGDPMQSIYGFREAEVGLFLKAWQEGLGRIDLEPIRLSVNFRSRKGVVDWVNKSFPLILPPENDAAVGAVAYTPAAPALPEAGEVPAVEVHPLVPADRQKEAETVLSCIRTARQADPEGRIAVLVRSRPHLEAILEILKRQGISFTAVEIESLKNRPVIRDLLSLARAISHPADRIAWLAVLRAPWCGMRLEDLHALAGDVPEAALLDLLQDSDRMARLNPDGRARGRRVYDILRPAVQNRERRSLRRLVEGAWLRLGGPAACFSAADFEDARAFLDFLDAQVGDDALIDTAGFEDAVARLFARPDPQGDERLQVMTIHKAKGLEFDTVILPGLDRSPPPAQGRLLMWLERAGRIRSDLLLAPMAAHGDESSRTYAYIREFEKKKRAYEDTRLLYVAATRAIKKLHLVGGARPGSGSGRVRAPAPNSLLAPLWPVVENDFEAAAAKDRDEADAGSAAAPAADEAPAGEAVFPIRRLVSGWQPPEPPQGLFPHGERETPQPADLPGLPPFNWAGEMVCRVGTVVHRWLRIICEQGLDDWSEKRVAAASERFRQDLRRAGVNEEMLDEAAAQVRSALGRTLSDPMGRWILSPHESGACEYALTGWIDKKAVHIIIDRTFVDEAGTRWIVDYKTGIHTGASVEAFLEQEKERYQEQMHTYARIMQAMEDRPVGLLLYYPRLQNHRQWMASPPS
mgnify:CR=1 FL=1